MPSGTNSIAGVARIFVDRYSILTPRAPNSPMKGLRHGRRSLPEEDTDALVDSSAGTPVRWVSGKGWVEEKE